MTYGGKRLDRLSRRERDTYRRDVRPVFQDPYSIFNPFYRVDRVFRQAIRRFRLAGDAETLVETALHAVRLEPADVLGRYPHQLSGGQRQRLMLARLHMLQPSFVIADEPVSMLDAQVRRNFLDIMVDFRRRYGMTTLFITHDLSTVAYVDPYTELLLASVPPPDPDKRWTDRITLDDGY